MESALVAVGIIVISSIIGFIASKREMSRKVTLWLSSIFTLIAASSISFALLNRGYGLGAIIFVAIGYFIALVTLPMLIISLPWRSWFRASNEQAEVKSQNNSLTWIITSVVLIVFIAVFLLLALYFTKG